MSKGKVTVIFISILTLSNCSLFNRFSQGWEYLGDAPFLARAWHSLNEFNGKLIIIGGERLAMEAGGADYHLHDIWTSTDGKKWDLITDSAIFDNPDKHNTIDFLGELWLFTNSSYYKSSNGTLWNKIISDEPYIGNSAKVVFKNSLWSFNGNEIKKSSDGLHWEIVTTNAGFDNQESGWDGYTVCSYGGKIWVFSGYPYLNDRTINKSFVYSSSNGINWTLINESAPCRARVGAKSIIYNDRIWIIGGYLGFGQNSKEVWATKDGIIWEQHNEGEEIPGLWSPGVAVFNDNLYMIGGYFFDNGIWRYKKGI